MAFRTMFDRERIYSPTGDAYRPNYQGVLDKKGNIVVEEKGQPINQYAYINSFADVNDLNVLVARFRAGDDKALNQRAGAYLDVRDLPDNINDLMALHYKLEQYFGSLPANVRSAFDNSVNVFVNNMGDPNFERLMSMSEDEINKKLAKEARETAQLNKSLVNSGKPQDDVIKPDSSPDATGLGSVEEMVKGVKK